MENQSTESQTPTTIPTPNTPPAQAPEQKNNNSVIIILCLMIALLVGVSAYLYGVNQGKKVTESQVVTIPTVTSVPITQTETTLSVAPSQYEDNSLGSTTVFFADSGTDIYLKNIITVSDSKIENLSNKSRTITNVYSQDKSMDPQEVNGIDASKFTWTELIKEPIKDSPNSKSILVNDRLFSFKKIPNTNNFLFVEEWDRSAGQNTGPWSPYQLERVLFMYDRSQSKGVLKKVQVFTSKENSYTYPKIDTFSPEGKYVSLLLFGCWNCGGHQPETLLLNLQTLKTKNIGKVLQFSWGQSGSYSYKDYIVIDCKEPQPGACNQDPDVLQLKTGQL